MDTTLKAKEDAKGLYSKMGMANVLIDRRTTEEYIKIFDDKIRRPVFNILNDKISQSVWMDKDSIRLLYECLTDPQNDLDGVRFHFIAYRDHNTAPGQYKENQTSIAIVPTQYLADVPPGASHHQDNWDVLKTEREEAMRLKDGALNHGELCPRNCPVDPPVES